ncbi:MAG: class B sortase [Bacillaceae bacterium]
MKKLLYWITMLFLVGVICFSGFKIYDYYSEVMKNNNYTEKVEKIFFKDTTATGIDHLKQENKDAVGWLKIDNTRINYPVVQTTDNEYYLNHTFDGAYSSVGTLFIDYRNNLHGKYQNFVIYGHSRKDGSMFRDVNAYVEDPSFSKNKNVTFYGEDGEYRGQIISAYEVDQNDDYTTPYFEDQAAYDKFIKEKLAKSEVDFNVTDLKHDRLITLSTCSKRAENIRVVVHILLKNVTES